MNFLILIFIFLNASHLTLSVNKPKVAKIRPSFDEIYGKGWDKNDHQKIKVETSPLNSGENALNEQADHDDNIDQDVEAYNSDSTDQNLIQEDPESIDQSDDETIEVINDENKFSEQEKREIISKFHTMREEFKKKRKFPIAARVKIECKIGTKLGVNRNKIYKWKKEFGLSRKIKINKNDFYEKKKREFIKRLVEIKMSQRGEQNKFAKDLGISEKTFINWKKEFELPVNSQIIYSKSEKLKLMKKYSKIKKRNLKIRDIDIANILNISGFTLYKWKNECGFSVNSYSKSEKLDLMEKYYKIKQKNLKIRDIDIAKRLNISENTLRKWKKQLKNSVYEQPFSENAGSVQDRDTSEHSMASSDDNLWAWNFAKKKRTERIEVEHSVKK